MIMVWFILRGGVISYDEKGSKMIDGRGVEAWGLAFTFRLYQIVMRSKKLI